MTDKELAEKVAEHLGWVKDGNVWNKWESSTYSSTKWLEPLEGKGGIEAVVFSWPVSGMMIDKIQNVHKGTRKWEIFWRDNGVSFCLPTQEWSADPDDPEWEKETKFYSCIDYGNHKAIAMAFCEAMEMIT